MADIDRDGWYRIRGYVYLGPDKPDEIIDGLIKVETIDHGKPPERRIYQNSGAALDLGQIIPNSTWTRHDA